MNIHVNINNGADNNGNGQSVLMRHTNKKLMLRLKYSKHNMEIVGSIPKIVSILIKINSNCPFFHFLNKFPSFLLVQ